jgi:nitroreductase
MDKKVIDEIIRTRRSVRRFKPDPVPRELLDEVLELACWAPSGMNRQPWHFVVVGAGSLRERLAEECGASFAPLEPAIKEVFADRPEVVERVRSFFRTLGGAPTVILAYCRVKDPYPSDMDSVAAAVQTLLLAAWARGLGTTWMAGPRFRESEINALLGMEEARLVAVIPIGYPDEQPKPAPRQSGRITYVEP